jgi:hypothetical protein
MLRSMRLQIAAFASGSQIPKTHLEKIPAETLLRPQILSGDWFTVRGYLVDSAETIHLPLH